MPDCRVVEDFNNAFLDQEQWPAEYQAFNQDTDTYFSLFIRTRQDEHSVLPSLASTIHKVSLDAALTKAQPWKSESMTHRQPTFTAPQPGSGGFAALALILGIVGLYRVIAYSVSQRTREIGVRMALGAQRSSVYELVLKEAGRLIAVGIVVGLAGSVALGMLMRKLLFGVQAWDAGTLAGVALLLAVSP